MCVDIRLNSWLSLSHTAAVVVKQGVGLEVWSLKADWFTSCMRFSWWFGKTFFLPFLPAVAFCFSRGILRAADVWNENFIPWFWDICIDLKGKVLAPGWQAAWVSVRAQLSSLIFGSLIIFIVRILQSLVEGCCCFGIEPKCFTAGSFLDLKTCWKVLRYRPWLVQVFQSEVYNIL